MSARFWKATRQQAKLTHNPIKLFWCIYDFNSTPLLGVFIIFLSGKYYNIPYVSVQDDANHDPQWSHEQLIEAKLTCGGLLIGPDEVDMMGRMTVTVFEILEKAWSSLDCALIDMKIEFGVIPKTGERSGVMPHDRSKIIPQTDQRSSLKQLLKVILKQVRGQGSCHMTGRQIRGRPSSS